MKTSNPAGPFDEFINPNKKKKKSKVFKGLTGKQLDIFGQDNNGPV
tara:strand:- start:131 stop:268 length:138 start_codon:yes stop_codon:yes gene_type:complete